MIKLVCKTLIFFTLLTYNTTYADTTSLVTNGDFSAGLNGWEEFKTGKAIVMRLDIVEDSNGYSHTVEFNRGGAKCRRGNLGISQSLNKDVSTYTSLFIKADVKLIYSSLNSDKLKDGAYPVTIELGYLTEEGTTCLFKHGFLYGNEIRYKNIGERIPQNQWYAYTSKNLLELSPKPKIITTIKFYGDGWGFRSRVANLQLLGEQKILTPEEIPEEKVEGTGEKIEEIPKKEMEEEKSEIVSSKIEKEEKLHLTEESEEPLITNVFVDVDLRQALRDIATQAQVTIIPDDSVQGVVSMELNNVPLEKALKMLLITGGYVFKKVEDYYLVGSPDPGNPTFPLLSTVEQIKLNYLKAESISNLLTEYYSKYIKIDKTENILVVTAPGEIIEEIKAYIKKIDLPPQQILIETVVTELSNEASKELGINWNAQGGKGKVELMQDFTLQGSYVSTGVSSEAIATIKVLAEKGKAKIKANPRILTLDGKSANINIGREEYHSLPGTAYQPGRFDKILSGITLKITPYIGVDDEITVAIEPEVSDVSAIGKEGYPIISKRSAQTTVRVKDGKTIIIGGLLQQKEENRISKIPIIGSIPGLGFFFRKTQTGSTETEVVIFITPHIMK